MENEKHNELKVNEMIDLAIKENDIQNYPKIIGQQIDKIEKINKKIENIKNKAENAKNNAVLAKKKQAGFGHKKVAIEALQESSIDIAETVSESIDTQASLFEYQKDLTDATKFLFAMGTMNITANRTVVRELQARLNGASKEELSDLARQELISTIKQLKAQEDLMTKQEHLMEISKTHEHKIAEHDLRLDASDKKDSEQDNKIQIQIEKDKEHDELLKKQADKDSEHDLRLDAGDKKDSEQDQYILELTQEQKFQENRISEMEDLIKNIQNQFAEKIDEQAKNLFNENRKLKISLACIGVFDFLVATTAVVLNLIF